MAEPEFTATRVQIGRRLRSLTRAGQVRISDGRLELLTSYGSEIDSAPVSAVRASRRWFGSADEASAELNGTRYVLRLDQVDSASGGPGVPGAPAAPGASSTPAARRFIEAVRRAGSRGR